MPRSPAKQFADSPVCPEWSEHQNPVTDDRLCEGSGPDSFNKATLLTC